MGKTGTVGLPDERQGLAGLLCRRLAWEMLLDSFSAGTKRAGACAMSKVTRLLQAGEISEVSFGMPELIRLVLSILDFGELQLQ